MQKDESSDTTLLREFACSVHASLCVLHAIAFFYNYRKKNYKNAAFHGAVLAYDAISFNTHLRDKEKRTN